MRRKYELELKEQMEAKKKHDDEVELVDQTILHVLYLDQEKRTRRRREA